MVVSRFWSSIVSGAVTVSMSGCSAAPADPGRVPGIQVSGGVLSAGGLSVTGGTGPVDENTGGLSMQSGGFGTTGGGATTGGSTNDPTKCGGNTVQPKTIDVEVEVEVTRPSPVAIYIMLDISGSMIPLWPGAVQAITEFVNAPASAGLDVALSLFPAAPGLDSCAAASYSPPLVPMGRLPGHAGAIAAGLPAFPIGAGTPIQGAVTGATEFCGNFTPADPADADEECVVLFITDGSPSACAVDTPSIVASAQAAGTPVYTIALNGVLDLTLLNGIADATGTDCDPGGVNSACDLTGGASFIDALSSIRDTIVTVETHTETQIAPLECEWGLPDPDPVKGFDSEEVNVILNGATGATPFGNVANEAACGNADSAWYYDDDDAPTRILACPKTCDVIKAAEGSTVEIQLGCPIIVLE